MPVAKIRQKLKRQRNTTDLSVRQWEMFVFMMRCLLSGYLPSYRDICDEMDIASPNGVVAHLKALERKGFVEIHHGTGYQLTDKALDLVL